MKYLLLCLLAASGLVMADGYMYRTPSGNIIYQGSDGSNSYGYQTPSGNWIINRGDGSSSYIYETPSGNAIIQDTPSFRDRYDPSPYGGYRR